jgi:uroporphyrinogen III methyltransferase/synthase
MVHLVGAGPGDPDLITVKGRELLSTCDVVIYDKLASSQLLDYLRDDCIKVYVGKEAGKHSKTQEEINQILITYAKEYAQVVRLKGGDSFVFGRGGEEIDELIKHNLEFELIPGVTSAISVPELAGIPVTHRGVSQSFHVITGHTKSSENTLTENYEELAKLDGTLVFLMGLGNLAKIVDKLIEHGKNPNTPVAVISNGTMANQRTVRATLATIEQVVIEAKLSSPAIIVVGPVAALDYSKRNVDAYTKIGYGLVGTKEIQDKITEGLRKHGVPKVNITNLCQMQLIKTKEIETLAKELSHISSYPWVIFTSQNAIKLFFETMDAQEIDRRVLSQTKFSVVGAGTKQALLNYGYQADFLPTKFSSADLAVELSQVVTNGEKVLIPRAKQGSEELGAILHQNHIDFCEIPIYDVVGCLAESIEEHVEVDCLVFASASGVTTFFEELQEKQIELSDNVKIACIGQVTAEELSKYGRFPEILAKVSDVKGLVDEIIQFQWD